MAQENQQSAPDSPNGPNAAEPDNASRPVDAELDWLKQICRSQRDIDSKTLERTILLAVEIAREGREGRKIGTMFVVSDSDNVLSRSRSLILDPLWRHPDHVKRLGDRNLEETVKELAQLDGAFIVSDSGVVRSACQYISASSEGIDLPLGLGTRHMAAASITKTTRAIAVVVSESSVVRIFDDGEITAEIIPELWLLRRHGVQLDSPYSMRRSGDFTIAQKRGDSDNN